MLSASTAQPVGAGHEIWGAWYIPTRRWEGIDCPAAMPSLCHRQQPASPRGKAPRT